MLIRAKHTTAFSPPLLRKAAAGLVRMCTAVNCLSAYMLAVGGPHLQSQALVEVVRAGPPLQSGEGHVSSGEGRDVAELVRAQGGPLVVSRADVSVRGLPVGLLARCAVILVGQPGPVLLGALVDGETLRPAGVEFQPHVRYLERLPCGKLRRVRLTLNGITERAIIVRSLLVIGETNTVGWWFRARSKDGDRKKKRPLLHYREMGNNGG